MARWRYWSIDRCRWVHRLPEVLSEAGVVEGVEAEVVHKLLQRLRVQRLTQLAEARASVPLLQKVQSATVSPRHSTDKLHGAYDDISSSVVIQ